MNIEEIKKALEIKDEGDQTFVAIDGLSSRYSLNHKGLLWDNNFKTVIFPHFSSNKLTYKISVNNEYNQVELNRLFLMAFSPMHVNFKTYTEVLKINVYDSNIILPDRNNLLWVVPKGGVECLNFPGYYAIPGNPYIAVSKQYDFLRISDRYNPLIIGDRKEVRIIPTTKVDGYPTVSISHNKDFPFSTRVAHRLIALAFIPIPKERNSLYINHKDGNKLNFDVENLEWCTLGDNNIHAFKTGLRGDNIPVIAVNIDTGKKIPFHSLQEASRNLNIHAWDISLSKKTFKECGYVKTKPWIFFDIEDKIPTSFIKIKKKILDLGYVYYKLTNLQTQEVNYLRGVRNLSRFLKTKTVEEITKDNLTFELNGYRIDKLSKEELPSDVLEKMREAWKNVGGKTQKPIRVTDLSNGSVITYKSTDEFAALVGAKRKTIQRRMLYNDSVWQNYKIEYI